LLDPDEASREPAESVLSIIVGHRESTGWRGASRKRYRLHKAFPVTTPVLTMAGVGRAYEPGHWIFRHLDLRVAPGERVALLGPSGSGKSTLLNLVAGLDRADEGAVAVAGQALESLDESARAAVRRRSIGFVFQAFHLVAHLAVWQNVAIPLLLLGVAADTARGRAEGMLDSLGLGARSRSLPTTLSGGEQQRVALARALVHEPALILADEPTGNLDPETAAVALSLIDRQTRSRNASLVLVTHSAQAAAIADRRLRLTPTALIDVAQGSTSA
jgi:putative ABC transport system ATP-binding protein